MSLPADLMPWLSDHPQGSARAARARRQKKDAEIAVLS
jgi:hypothetical protein